MKMDKELLKKHHFWLLFAPFLVFVVVAIFTLWSGIGGKIEAREKAIESEEKAAKGKTGIKPIGELTLLNEENARVALIRYDKWRENWDLQLGVDEYFGTDRWDMKQTRPNQFRWPVSGKLNDFNYSPDGYTDAAKVEDRKPKFKGLKFGVDIPNKEGERLEFQKSNVYLAEYSNAEPTKPGSGTGMADRLYPTQFAGGWSSVLRHVYAADASAGYGWGTGRPNSPEIWLALEDLWVQRSLLNSLQGVNERMAAFTEQGKVNGHQMFQSRTWQIELWTVTRASDNKRVLVATLTNLTPRIQTFGLNGKLTFKVQIKGGGPPVDLVFNERYLTGRGGTKIKQEGAEEKSVPGDVLTITPEKGTDLSQAGVAADIESVRQVFDTRTVPIQRIDKLVLGYPDSRLAGMKPRPPKFLEVAEEPPPEGDGLTTGGPGPMGPGPLGPAASSSGSRDGGPGSGGATSGSVGAGWPVVYGPVTSKSLLDSTKKRYIQVTDHVRRMPVGMVLVVDQSNLQDVLLALANSPLRFQITQVHWQRFRGTIAGNDAGSGSSGPGPGGPDSSRGPLVIGSPDGGGTGPSIRVNPRRPGPGGPGPMGPMPGPGPMGPGGEDGSFAEADLQMTSGLIEITVYGIVSLYEKYESEQAQPTTNP